ncbi:hypothetical protein HYU19_04015 [Candidatus Woesearchaeota archaeon]|nr:hypothetical protein [Candidatus Woesearchaeota archaeon]
MGVFKLCLSMGSIETPSSWSVAKPLFLTKKHDFWRRECIIKKQNTRLRITQNSHCPKIVSEFWVCPKKGGVTQNSHRFKLVGEFWESLNQRISLCAKSASGCNMVKKDEYSPERSGGNLHVEIVL